MYGIFTEIPREKGEFLLEYPGNLITADEGEQLSQKYSESNKGCVLYFFIHDQKEYWYV